MGCAAPTAPWLLQRGLSVSQPPPRPPLHPLPPVENLNIESLGASMSGYLAPVSCSKMFSYTWWITFYGEL